MVSPKYSRLLSAKFQLAKANKDDEMIKKMQSIKYDFEVTKEILNYRLKGEKNGRTNN